MARKQAPQQDDTEQPELDDSVTAVTSRIDPTTLDDDVDTTSEEQQAAETVAGPDPTEGSEGSGWSPGGAGPDLSGLAGSPATDVGLDVGIGIPSLDDLTAGAGDTGKDHASYGSGMFAAGQSGEDEPEEGEGSVDPPPDGGDQSSVDPPPDGGDDGTSNYDPGPDPETDPDGFDEFHDQTGKSWESPAPGEEDTGQSEDPPPDEPDASIPSDPDGAGGVRNPILDQLAPLPTREVNLGRGDDVDPADDAGFGTGAVGEVQAKPMPGVVDPVGPDGEGFGAGAGRDLPSSVSPGGLVTNPGPDGDSPPAEMGSYQDPLASAPGVEEQAEQSDDGTEDADAAPISVPALDVELELDRPELPMQDLT
jgi:hypothetical protein